MPAGNWVEVEILPHEENLDKHPLIYPDKQNTYMLKFVCISKFACKFTNTMQIEANSFNTIQPYNLFSNSFRGQKIWETLCKENNPKQNS